jgi:hypothetical protein
MSEAPKVPQGYTVKGSVAVVTGGAAGTFSPFFPLFPQVPTISTPNFALLPILASFVFF